MIKITLDFECRSKVNLKKSGAWVYAADPSTEIMCMAYKYEEQETSLWAPDKFVNLLLPEDQKVWGKRWDQFFLSFSNLAGDPKVIFEAHNAGFEQAIWAEIMVKRHGFPPIPISRWRCSAAKAASYSLPRSLDGACSALGLKAQKDNEGHNIMLRLCKPKKPSKAPPGIWDEDPVKLIKLFEYCKQDVEAEHELSAALPGLSPAEQNLWFYDQKINQRGIHVDLVSIQNIIDMVLKHKDKLNADCKRITGANATQRDKLICWMEKHGVITEVLQKQTVIDLLKTDITEIVKKVLRIRQQVSQTGVDKYNSMLARSGGNSRVKDTMMFWGANTGRWAGKGIQPHNFRRDCYKKPDEILELINSGNTDWLGLLYEDPITVASKSVRGVINAAQGNELICADYSSIEGRFLAWLAGAEWKLQMYRDGISLYKIAASNTYEISYEDVTEDQRQVGKVEELALGYQGGWRALKQMADAYGVKPPPGIEVRSNKIDEENDFMEWGEILDEENAIFRKWAKPIVTNWRDSNPEILDLWASYEWAAHSAVEKGGMWRVGKVQFGVQRGFLRIRLPSGRLLAYYDPQIRVKETPWGDEKKTLCYMGVNTKKQWVRKFSYGGKLVENITQAGSRDLLAEAIPRVEKAGYPVIFHVHDEIISEVPAREGSLAEFEQLMAVVPDWATGCPIVAKGWRGQRYRK